MKRFLMLALGTTLLLPVIAQAQGAAPARAKVPAQPPAAPHSPADGHDYDHEAESKPDPNETTSDYLWRKSDAAFHDGDYPRAVELHKAIVAYDPTDVESYSVASWLLWSMGKKDEAIAFLQRGIKANPQNPEMWDAAGQHYDLQKRYADAKDAFGKAVEFAGANPDQMMRRRFAHASEKAGDLSGSVTVWQGLVRDYPNEVVNKNNLVRVEGLQAAKGGATPVAPVAAVGGAAILGLMALRRRETSA